MSKLKVKSLAIGKESRYLSVPGGKGFKREYWRLIAETSKGQLMLKVLIPSPDHATGVLARVQEKGFIDSKHWEV